jgi:hypothetical protein
MTKAFALAVLLATTAAMAAPPRRAQSSVLVETQMIGTHVPLGVVTATTTKNNHDTAVPFNNTGDALKAMTLQVQCDVDAYFGVGTTNAATVTTANGVYLEAKKIYVLSMSEAYGWVAFLSVSGTATCKVWQLI